MTCQMILRLALEAVVSDRTVKRWLANPSGVSSNSRARLERAATSLGYPLPGPARLAVA
jgi:DNA-binding LacI/PurR family transcriptional regulator